MSLRRKWSYFGIFFEIPYIFLNIVLFAEPNRQEQKHELHFPAVTFSNRRLQSHFCVSHRKRIRWIAQHHLFNFFGQPRHVWVGHHADQKKTPI